MKMKFKRGVVAGALAFAFVFTPMFWGGCSFTSKGHSSSDDTPGESTVVSDNSMESILSTNATIYTPTSYTNTNVSAHDMCAVLDNVIANTDFDVTGFPLNLGLFSAAKFTVSVTGSVSQSVTGIITSSQEAVIKANTGLVGYDYYKDGKRYTERGDSKSYSEIVFKDFLKNDLICMAAKGLRDTKIELNDGVVYANSYVEASHDGVTSKFYKIYRAANDQLLLELSSTNSLVALKVVKDVNGNTVEIVMNSYSGSITFPDFSEYVRAESSIV